MGGKNKPVVLQDSRLSENDASAVLLAGGDFCPINRFEEKILSGGQIFDGHLLEIFRQKDIFLVNQEAVLGDAGMTASSPAGYGLRCSPEVASYIRSAGVDYAGLANNHIRDFGDCGVESTLKALHSAGIKTLGAGMDEKAAEEPVTAVINGLAVGLMALAEKELNIAGKKQAGAAAFEPEINAARIKDFKKELDFLAVYVHAGHEFMTVPSPRIRGIYRKFIESGADIIIGHHPHVVQGVEKYRGGWILYSLGNLVFDSAYVSGYPNTDVGFLARITAAAGRVAKLEIIPYRISRDISVRSLAGAGAVEFEELFSRISLDIIDEDRFCEEWRKNVLYRWEQDYRGLMSRFSDSLFNPCDLAFPRSARNLVTCPTHAEIMEKILLLMEEGAIKRERPSDAAEE